MPLSTGARGLNPVRMATVHLVHGTYLRATYLRAPSRMSLMAPFDLPQLRRER